MEKIMMSNKYGTHAGLFLILSALIPSNGATNELTVDVQSIQLGAVTLGLEYKSAYAEPKCNEARDLFISLNKLDKNYIMSLKDLELKSVLNDVHPILKSFSCGRTSSDISGYYWRLGANPEERYPKKGFVAKKTTNTACSSALAERRDGRHYSVYLDWQHPSPVVDEMPDSKSADFVSSEASGLYEVHCSKMDDTFVKTYGYLSDEFELRRGDDNSKSRLVKIDKGLISWFDEEEDITNHILDYGNK